MEPSAVYSRIPSQSGVSHSKCFGMEGKGSTRNNPTFVRERSQYGRVGWMVWGGFSIGGSADLHIIRTGTLMARRYADEILRPLVIPYAAGIGHSFLFYHDNARPHTALLVETMLETETIQRMDWPARSLDLNPVEHVWVMLG